MSYFKAKMHQIRFRLGSAPYPAGEAYSAPLAVFWGPTKGGEEKGIRERESWDEMRWGGGGGG